MCVTIVVHIGMEYFREKTDGGWFVGIVLCEFHEKTKSTTFPGGFVRTVVIMTRQSINGRIQSGRNREVMKNEEQMKRRRNMGVFHKDVYLIDRHHHMSQGLTQK